MACEPARRRACLTAGVKVVLCAAVSVLLVKLVSDRQQGLRWHAKLLGLRQPACPDLLLGPQPRLDWPQWAPLAADLAEEVKEADAGEGWDAVFYGDSITEQWRGSCVGVRYPSLARTQEEFEAHFNRNYTSHVLAIAGDQVGHLWWRLLHGDVPVTQHPKAAVLLIGTNDMTAADCHASPQESMRAAAGVVARVQEVLALLRARLPDTEVVLLALLPRDAHVLSGPPAYEWPNRMSGALAAANAGFQELAAADSHTHFLDCGASYILPGGGLDAKLLPDALHPNADGMERMAGCIQPLLDRLVLQHPASAAPL